MLKGFLLRKLARQPPPRDLNEQVLWNLVKQNPEMGFVLKLDKELRFSTDDGFQKMQASHELPNGKFIVIHHQYNKYTGKAYDMKFDTPKRNELQPAPSIKEGDKK